MVGFVTLPSNFTALVATNAGTIFTDLAPVAVLIAGVLLGLFVINWLISMIRSKDNNETADDWKTRYYSENQDNDNLQI